jgi:AAA family ATP:ADP antiporter
MNDRDKSEGWIHRALKLVTDVRPGEAGTALLLTANVFLLLMAYYIIKPIRESFILSEWTPEDKAYLFAAMAFFLIFVVKGFSRLASRVPRQKLITWVSVFFISNIALFYVLHLAELSGKAMGIIYFIWVGIFNVTVIAQFWAFANDLYTEDMGRRLFPLVAFGAVFGGFVGSTLTRMLTRALGEFPMLLIAAAILGLCIVFTLVIHNREVGLKKAASVPQPAAPAAKLEEEKPVAPGGGFKLVWKNRYLLYIALFVLLLNFINQNGQYILDRIAAPAAEKIAAAAATEAEHDLLKRQFLTEFYAGFMSLQGLWSMALQLFFVSRIFKWFGVRVAIFILPAIALGGYLSLGFVLSLGLVKVFKAIENGTDYSLMNTTRHSLFLITTRVEKYKAKAAIDTFFHRTGDALNAGLVFLNMILFKMSISSLARLNFVFVVLWICVGALIYREHKRRTAGGASA